MNFDIAKVSHAELIVTDLERAKHFYVDLLGLIVTESEKDRVFLRSIEEREHHSLVLTKGNQPSLNHLAFKVSEPENLNQLAGFLQKQGRPVQWLEDTGHGKALRTKDPVGLPIEFIAHMAKSERLLQRYDLHRGPGILRLDHFNVQVPNVQLEFDWYQELGFRLSEFTETEDGRLWAAWLFRKQTVHDLALMNGRGPRLHHIGFFLEGALNIIKACDILASAGFAASIERGPGRHGLSNAMFLYLRDPDGHRIELYASDYLTADPELEPIRWAIDDPRRQTFWGHKAPDCWFEEATLVQDIETGNLIETKPGQLADKPVFAT